MQHGVEFGRRLTPGRSAFRFAAGEPVRAHRVGAEPGSHVGTRQCGELSDGPNPHPPQQIRQIVPSGTGQAGLGGELADRQRRQEPRVFSRFDDTAGTGGEDRSGQLVGDPDLTLGAGAGHRVGQPLGGLLFGPEKAGRPTHRQHHESGPQHLGARRHIVHRRDNPFEEASIAVGVGSHDVQLRTAGRRLPSSQSTPHSRRTGSR